jgi:predicted nucleic acid-binding protein
MSIRPYADTSVYRGLHDPEFSDASRTFFEHVRAGRFDLVTSAVVAEELSAAPDAVRDDFEAILPHTEIVEITPESLDLQEAYLDAGILMPQWEDDALHMALATAGNCELVVSWNFTHIVHFQKIPQYNAVNQLHGYDTLAIHSPPEVISDDDPDEGD